MHLFSRSYPAVIVPFKLPRFLLRPKGWHRLYALLFSITGVVYLLGAVVDVMDVDASQYAAMGMELMQRKAWFIITDRYDAGYMDKPPLLFWLVSRAYIVLGFHNWSYKLPSVVSSVIATYAIYRYTQNWYGNRAARFALIMLPTSVAYILFNNDVRTDALQINYLVLAMWHLSEYVEMRPRRWLHLAAAFASAALGMMAKGPMAIVLPAVALVTHLALRRVYPRNLHWHLLAGMALFTIIISPALYSYWLQHGTEGIRFFLWTQSFGRITGENVWANNPPTFYLYENLAWAALPWTIPFVLAVVWQIKRLARQKFKLRAGQEGMSLGIIIFISIALSLSRYQLPHYIFIIVPYCIAIAGAYVDWTGKSGYGFKWLSRVQGILYLILWSAGFLLASYVFPRTPLAIWLGCALVTVIGALAWRRLPNVKGRIVYPGAALGIYAGLIMNGSFYPQLMKYQTTRAVAQDVARQPERRSSFCSLGPVGAHSLDFYSHRIVANISREQINDELRERGTLLIYTDADNFRYLKEEHRPALEVETIKSYAYYPVAFLSIQFLNPATRNSTLQRRELLRVRIAPQTKTFNSQL